MLKQQLSHRLKAVWQETKAKKDLILYSSLASRQGPAPQNQDLKAALYERIRNRISAPREKGDLHIFLACSINNWEAILPKVLAEYGRLSSFHWPSTGFYPNRNEWLKDRNKINADMLLAFKSANKIKKVDIVVGYASDFNTSPETFRTMAEAGAVIFNLCWDDKLHFSGAVKGQSIGVSRISSSIDLNLTSTPESIIKYWACGGLALFWPEAAHPAVCMPYKTDFEFDVLFVGSKYGWRGAFIDQLMRDGIRVQAYGMGWDTGIISDEEMIRSYSKSRIVLGFSSIAYSRKLVCLKGRDFEVPLSGALYLTQHNPELALVYEIGREILTYKDYNDCLNKIRKVLANPEQAAEIRHAGRTRALRDHTWQQRFDDLFAFSGLMVRPTEFEKGRV